MAIAAHAHNGYGNGAIAPRRSVVALEQISRIYGTGEAMVKACDRISLTIEQGEYCAIMGESGSGKTTLMNIIGCLDRPTHGRYLLDGVDVSRLGKNRLARIRNRNIGFVFQRYELLNNLTAMENVMLPMMYAGIGRNQRRRLAAAALQHIGWINARRSCREVSSSGSRSRGRSSIDRCCF